MEKHVRVFCPLCKGGENAIWEGSLFEWEVELSKPKPPAWYVYAENHRKAHGHTIMVQYPHRTVPLFLSEILRETT